MVHFVLANKSGISIIRNMSNGAHKNKRRKKMKNFETIEIEYAEIGCPRYNKVIGKIKRAATIARKNGLPEPKVLSEEEFVTKERCALGNLYEITNVRLKLDRTLVKVDGYRLAAHIDDQGVISRICDEEFISDDDITRLRDSRKDCYTFCDHCGTARKRKMVIVCQDKKTGDLKSFGRDCLEVVTGIKLTDSYLDADAFNIGDEDMPLGAWFREGKTKLDIDTVLLVGSAVIKQDGFVSRRDAESEGRPSTSNIVREVLSNNDRMEKLLEGHGFNTQSVKDWVINSSNASNYMTNLKIIFQSEFIGFEYVGYIVSAIASKQNEENRKAEAEARAAGTPESLHLGSIGERLFKKAPVDAKLTFVRYMNSAWGSTTLMKFRTTQGHVLTWFASGYYEVKAGDACTISGATVKKHSEFNGQKETAVNRVSLEWVA